MGLAEIEVFIGVFRDFACGQRDRTGREQCRGDGGSEYSILVRASGAFSCSIAGCTRWAKCRPAPGCQRDIRRQIELELYPVIGGPARGWNLDHPGVVKSPQARIEIRVGPDRAQFGGADGVGPARDGQVDGVAYGGEFAIGAGLRPPDQAMSYRFSPAARHWRRASPRSPAPGRGWPPSGRAA